MQPQIYSLTATGKKKLEDELVYLKTVKQKEVSEQIKEHRGYCDFADNASFSQTLNQQNKIRNRIAELETILLNAALIEPDDESETDAKLGNTVTVINLADGNEEIYTLVAGIEANPFINKISINSPIGKKLLGSKIDEVLTIDIPAGKIKVKVIAIK